MKSSKGDILNINPSSEMDNARNVSFGHFGQLILSTQLIKLIYLTYIFASKLIGNYHHFLPPLTVIICFIVCILANFVIATLSCFVAPLLLLDSQLLFFFFCFSNRIHEEWTDRDKLAFLRNLKQRIKLCITY